MLDRLTVARHNTVVAKAIRLAHFVAFYSGVLQKPIQTRWVVLRDMILGGNAVPTASANSATAYGSLLFHEAENSGTESIRITNWAVVVHVAENNFLGFWHAPLKCFDHYGEV